MSNSPDVHDASLHIQQISELRDRAVALDPDTYTSPESYEIALLAAGAAIDAVERTMAGSHAYTLAMVRPPGHHAEHAHAMGFCFFNNVAVAAAHATHALGAKRVAIVDFDVHHGNGTQHMFERDASVLYVSTHQYPHYLQAPAPPMRSAQGQVRASPSTCRLNRAGPTPTITTSSIASSCRCCASSRRICCSCPPASTHTNAIRWRR